MDYIWKYRNLNPIAAIDYEKAGIPTLLAKVLYNRGCSADDYDLISNNLFDMAAHYCDNIVGLHSAANRINRALLDKNTVIYVFSDYDTDGITSAAIFNDFANALVDQNNSYNKNFNIYIPEREEGYGLNTDWCTSIITEKNKEENQDKNFLVITFDNGITKNFQIQYLRKNGIEVIITDHHEPGTEIPSGIVVDPKKDDEKIGEELCGAGISWLIVYQLYRMYFKNNPAGDTDKLISSLERALEYAAVGTIGDMMNMTKFNLSLVKKGLECLNKKGITNKSPLTDLIEVLTQNAKSMSFEITSKDIGFTIAAAINACGQMGKANTAMDLFLGKCSAEEAAKYLNISQNETKKAKNKINKDLDNGIFDNDLICIYTMQDIPKGIAGKLSNYICSCTGKPAIVLADDTSITNEIIGSARCSNPTIDILDLLKKLEADNLIKSAAGHKAACGVVFYKDKIKEARNKLNELIVDKIEKGESEINPKADLNIDSAIEIKDIIYKNYKDINNIPYSMNFSAPNLLLRGYIAKAKISSSNENNICYTVRDLIGNNTIDIWVWNKKAQEYKNKKPKKISIVGNLVRNFMRPGDITMDVVDLRFE